MIAADKPEPVRRRWITVRMVVPLAVLLLVAARQATGCLAWLGWGGFALIVLCMIGSGLRDIWSPWWELHEPDPDQPAVHPRRRSSVPPPE